MSYDKLYFWTVHFNLSEKISPAFKCPVCGTYWSHNYRLRKHARLKAIDFNRRVRFRCPKCGTIIRLYVAIHKDEHNPPSICVSVNPIPNDWWVIE